MLCPIFSMVVSQKYVPSAVCYIWHPEMVPIGFDQPLFLTLLSLILLTMKSFRDVCPPTRHF